MNVRKAACLLLIASMLLPSALCGCAGSNEQAGTDGTEASETEDTPMPKTKMEKVLSEADRNDSDYYKKIAQVAVQDLIDHFWVGDAATGNVLPTWKGLPEDLADERGAIWEAAEVLFNIYDMWVLTGDETYKDMVAAEANYFKTNYLPEDLESPGTTLNTASDDCAWHAMLYLNFYNVTDDEWFVERAENLLDNAYDRWHDDKLGGGLWYSDTSNTKSLYEAGIALDWLRLWEITKEQRFYDLALESYEWIQTCLGRDDGIYFCETTESGPNGEFSPGNIHEGGSCSFLGGNMAMAVLSAKFYKLTGEQKYLDRVSATNGGLMKYYDRNGVLLNDRDAWTNGTFATLYSSDVLSLSGTEDMRALLKATAVSIAENDRTPDGYYGGAWEGPADGAASIWSSGGSIPQQTMTSGTTVAIIMAAAILEAGIDDYVR